MSIMSMSLRTLCLVMAGLATVTVLAVHVLDPFSLKGSSSCSGGEFDISRVLQSWQSKIEQGFDGNPGKKVFRDNFSDVQIKDLGSGFKAQYSNAHSTKKVYHLQKEKQQTRTPAEVISVVRPFDATKFNFNKASNEEILTRAKLEYFTLAEEETLTMCTELDNQQGIDAHGVFVNLSPLTKGHFLFVPHPTQQLPQVLTEEAVRLGLILTATVARQRPDFKILYNSLGAFASVNHLHLQGVFLDGVYKDSSFPVERVVAKGLETRVSDTADGRVEVSRIDHSQFPVRVLVFSVDHEGTGKAEKHDHYADILSTAVHKAVAYMLEHNIPHNLLLVTTHKKATNGNSGRTVAYLFPRKQQQFMGGKDKDMGVAGFEICGHAIVKTPDAFDKFTRDAFHRFLREHVSLHEEEFNAIVGLFG